MAVIDKCDAKAAADMAREAMIKAGCRPKSSMGHAANEQAFPSRTAAIESSDPSDAYVTNFMFMVVGAVLCGLAYTAATKV